jgi:hypothetical protein
VSVVVALAKEERLGEGSKHELGSKAVEGKKLQGGKSTMPTYCYRRQLAPSQMKESLVAVKHRLTMELSERTSVRVRYWARREAWCCARPGRLLFIGWDTYIAQPCDLHASASSASYEHPTDRRNNHAMNHVSSYMEMPN